MTAPTRTPRTLDLACGPMVVDVWTPAVDDSGITPVLLVHGWGGSGSYWAEVAADLARDTTVYVPDLPGTGRSQPVKSAQNIRAQVSNLLAMVDALRLNRLQVIGHSMGSAMALLMAEARPGLVERLILTSFTFFKTEAQKRTYRRVMSTMYQTMKVRAPWMANVPGAIEMMGKQYFYRLPRKRPVLRQGLVDYLELDYDTAIACADDATDPMIPTAGATWHGPTLLIAARNDMMMPQENVAYTLDILQDADVRWIERCGHIPMVEKTGEFLQHTREFLALKASALA